MSQGVRAISRVDLRRVSTGRLRKWARRFDAMPSWAFLIGSVRALRFAVENELLARDMANIAAEEGGHSVAPPEGMH